MKPGEFVFSAVRLDHGHIYGMCNGLTEAGATLKYVYDPDEKKVAAFLKAFPQAKAARSEEEALSDPETHLIAGAAITSERCALGLRVLDAGKDYFTDKAPFTTMAQLQAARAKVAETEKKYMVYYSERLHDEGSVLAGELVKSGAIGKVVAVNGFGPHRLGAAGRPAWFFEREKYGGISGVHAQVLSTLDGVELAACADIRPERAQRMAEKFACHAYVSLEAMLDAEKLDAVHLCTPHHLHPDMALTAAQRGVAVFT